MGTGRRMLHTRIWNWAPVMPNYSLVRLEVRGVSGSCLPGMQVLEMRRKATWRWHGHARRGMRHGWMRRVVGVCTRMGMVRMRLQMRGMLRGVSRRGR